MFWGYFFPVLFVCLEFYKMGAHSKNDFTLYFFSNQCYVVSVFSCKVTFKTMTFISCTRKEQIETHGDTDQHLFQAKSEWLKKKKKPSLLGHIKTYGIQISVSLHEFYWNIVTHIAFTLTVIVFCRIRAVGKLWWRRYDPQSLKYLFILSGFLQKKFADRWAT